MYDIIPYATLAPLAVIVVGYIIKAFAGILARLVYGKAATDQNRYVAFMDDCAARGVGYAEAMQEWRVRTEFARLRRETSDAVALDVANWKEILDRQVQIAFNRLAGESTDLLPLFGAMLRGTSYGDILYPAEARMVGKLYRGVNLPMTADRSAALNVI